MFADDQPYTVDDCLEASKDALHEVDAQGAYDLTVELFFELTPGYACYGVDCWTASDF